MEKRENRYVSMRNMVQRMCSVTGEKEAAFKEQLSQVDALRTNFRSIVAKRAANFGKKKAA